jgi:hypothetical protein
MSSPAIDPASKGLPIPDERRSLRVSEAAKAASVAATGTGLRGDEVASALHLHKSQQFYVAELHDAQLFLSAVE